MSRTPVPSSTTTTSSTTYTVGRPSEPARVTTNPAATAASLRNKAEAELHDPEVRGALYGAAAVSVAAAAAYGLYSLYSYYSVRRAQYTLTYFNGRGLAEVSRYMFALAGVPYEDQRMQGTSQSPAFAGVKDQFPYGQVPVLQVNGANGQTIAQSRAIERFLARRFGFLGGSDLQTAVIDSVGEAVADLRQAWLKVREAPEGEKQKFFGTTLPTALRYINRVANEASTSAERNTLVGSSITLADLQLFHFLSIFDDQRAVAGAVEPYPVVRASRANVANHPAIAEWIAKRPGTEF